MTQTCTSDFHSSFGTEGRVRMLKVRPIFVGDPTAIGPFCDPCYEEIRAEMRAMRAEGRMS